MKILSLFFLFSLSQSLFSKEERIIANVQKNDPESRSNPSEYCLLGENKKYRGYSYRISGKNIYLKENQTLKTDVAYIFEGKWQQDLTQHIQEISDYCEPEEVREQIRSDWLAEENRMRDGQIISWSRGVTTRERLKEMYFFEISKYKELDAFRCKASSKKIEIEIKSIPEFKGMKIRMVSHYEGGRGKPQPKFLNQKIKLKTHNTKIEVPKSIQESGEGRKNSFRLENITFQGEGKDYNFNYDLSVHKCK